MKLKKIVILCTLACVTPLSYANMPVIDGAVLTAVNSFNSSVSSILGQILRRLTQSAGEANTSATKIAESVSQSGDNTAQRAIDTQREQNAQNAARNTRMPIDPCANGARGLADPNFDRIRPGIRSGGVLSLYGSGGGITMPSTGSVSLNKSIQISNGFIAAPSPETQALLAQEGACTAYASGLRKTSCENAGTRVGPVTLENADVRASSLIDGAQTRGNESKISYSFNPEQLAAANAYMRNITNPIALRELKPAESRTEEGRKYFALRDAHAARLNLSARPAHEWMSDKTKDVGTIPILKAMLDGGGAAAQYLAKQLPKEAPDWSTQGISFQQLMKFEADRRYKNVDWIKEIANTSDPLTLEREHLMIASMRADLATNQLLATQETNIMLGAIYQASLNKDFMPEVIAQHRKAKATR